ncbi:hypothetical protein M0R45_017658 [Rubus argutus]|uniref:Uncharacterized protein n=1 Tax=Rubus argutus TaxID=59490 RepID=A0AAW1XWS9_RUBAR
MEPHHSFARTSLHAFCTDHDIITMAFLIQNPDLSPQPVHTVSPSSTLKPSPQPSTPRRCKAQAAAITAPLTAENAQSNSVLWRPSAVPRHRRLPSQLPALQIEGKETRKERDRVKEPEK